MTEIEDISYSGMDKSDRNILYSRGVHSPGRSPASHYTCSPKKAALIVAGVIFSLFIISLIAAFARPGCPPPLSSSPITPSPTFTQSHQTTHHHIATTTADPQDYKMKWKNLRLPSSLSPQTYEVLIHPNLEKFIFNGWSSVEVFVNKSTDYIVMHVKGLNLSNINVRYNDRADKIDITDEMISQPREQLYIQLAMPLVVGSTILLNVSFVGLLNDDLYGFFRNSYMTRGGIKRYLAATQFEPTDARAAFPCFDEPHLKAKFKFSIIRPNNYISLFNTEKISEQPVSPTETMDVYNSTVKMSTYLVAFVVCDFNVKSKLSNGGVNVSVYFPPEASNDANMALDTATKVLDFYEGFYGIKYPLSKLDNVAIPDMTVGAMENWGLVLYLSRFLLHNENRNSELDKNMVANVVAHELAHQWFGNLVTMEWWNDLWLNEGFARYIQYLGTNHVLPDWPMMEHFIVSTVSQAMNADSSDSSHPVSDPVYDPKEINEIFDSISYDKGAAVIRMLESVVGHEVFHEALKNYLTKHQYSTANNNDLWESFTQQVHDTIQINVKEMMDTWTLQMGFPLVSLQRQGRRVIGHQERFIAIDHAKLGDIEVESPEFNYTWFIPLTYITDKKPHIHEVVFMKEKSIEFELPEDVEWLKANSNMSGFYRVHYDEEGWSAIIRQLKADHNVFSPLDRSNLINDIFSLIKTGHVNLTTALELSTYLERDLSYNPWRMMVPNIRYINYRFASNAHYPLFKKYLKKLMSPILNKLEWNDVGDHDTKLMRIMMMTLATELGFPEYVSEIQESFKQVLNGTLRLSPNQQQIVYSNAVRYGGEGEWDHVMNITMTTTTPPAQRSVMLEALTYTNNILKINRLLEMSLNSSIMKVSECYMTLQGIGRNSAGQLLLWNFIRKNWGYIFERFHGMPKRLRIIVKSATFLFSTQMEYDELKSFLSEHMSESPLLSIDMLDNIRLNINWKNQSEEQLVSWLHGQSL